LFTLIDIQFFHKLFQKTWFLAFCVPFFLAAGLYISHITTNVVRNLRLVLMIFCRYLLPALAFISLLFLIMGSISFFLPNHTIKLDINIFLTISLLSIILINGVYQDGNDAHPYPTVIQACITIFLIVTPLFTLLALYSLLFNTKSIVILSSGLHHHTVFSLIYTCILLIYNLCYATIAALKQKPWLKSIEKTNIVLAIIVILTTLFINNPWV
jgi:hypothetical protein